MPRNIPSKYHDPQRAQAEVPYGWEGCKKSGKYLGMVEEGGWFQEDDNPQVNSHKHPHCLLLVYCAVTVVVIQYSKNKLCPAVYKVWFGWHWGLFHYSPILSHRWSNSSRWSNTTSQGMVDTGGIICTS